MQQLSRYILLQYTNNIIKIFNIFVYLILSIKQTHMILK